MTTDSRLIVALDLASSERALELAARLAPEKCRLKVGLELFTASGPAIVTGLRERGFEIFLDLKYHDIPNTVARAVKQAADLGVWMINVHALGGSGMLEAARRALDDHPRAPLLTAVTLLTSHSDDELNTMGYPGGAEKHVKVLAQLAGKAGLDGVVCSPREARSVRADLGRDFIIVTPGIRPAGSPRDDQRRTLTPREAIEAGADYLVIGRPVTRAEDPDAVVDRINREILGD